MDKLDIIVESLNEVHLRFYSDDPGIESEIVDFFTFIEPNAKYTPKFKAGLWDGKIRLANPTRKTLYVGLIEYLEDFAKKNNYKINYANQIKKCDNISLERVQEYVDSLNIHSKGIAIQPRDYQFNTIHEALVRYRAIIQSPTSCLDPETLIDVELDDAGVKFLKS